MPLFTSARLGDVITLRDRRTGAVVSIEIDNLRGKRARLGIDAPPHIEINTERLNDRVASDKQAFSESKHGKPGPVGSSRVASAMLAQGGGA